MNTYGVDPMGRRHRRWHTAVFKAAVVKKYPKSEMSMAAAAPAHSLNANILRK